MSENIVPLDQLGMNDVPRVGGKNASLGEMISNLGSLGVEVPDGFATTAHAFNEFLDQAGIRERIHQRLDRLDTDDVKELAVAGAEIRGWVIDSPLPDHLQQEISTAYEAMAINGKDATVAVRSSATAEDLPDASFAGQQETFLNISGLDHVLHAIKLVFASLFNDRAISYRVHQGFEHADVALSAGIQRMVRSDLASSGVMFSIDTESGFEDAVFITSSYGLGETVVQGAVNPDEFYVYKKNLDSASRSILHKNRGSKLIKMVYAEGDSPENAIQTVEVDSTERELFSINAEVLVVTVFSAMESTTSSVTAAPDPVEAAILAEAAIPRIFEAIPGTSGTPDMVIFASSAVWAMPDTMGCSTLCSSVV